MPLPNAHAAVIRPLSAFQEGTIKTIKRKHNGKDYSILIGRPTGKAKTDNHSLHYPTSQWTPAQARAHAKGHGAKKFEVAKAAAGRVALSAECPSCIMSAGDIRDNIWERVGGTLWMHPLLQIGKTYRHPADNWERLVDRDWADRLANSIAAAATNGMTIPLLRHHCFDEKPGSGNPVLGYIEGALIKDGWLHGLAKFQNAEARDECLQVEQLSAGFFDEVTDGNGDKYRPALHHVATTPFPVANRQSQTKDEYEDYVPIAATRGRSAMLAPVLMMSAASDGGSAMDPKLLESLRGLLGRDDLTEEAAPQAVQEWMDARKSDDDVVNTTILVAAKEQIKTLEAKVTELEAKAAKKPELNLDVAAQLEEGADTAYDALAASGRLTPAQRDRFKKELVRDAATGKLDGVALSRAISGRPKPVAFLVADILQSATPQELRELTRSQSVTSSREEPDDAGKEYSDKVHDEMKAMGRSGKTATQY